MTSSIQKAYYDQLNGNVEINGAVVPVLDKVTAATPYPFIVLSSANVVDWTDDSSVGNEVMYTIKIVTGFQGDTGGKKMSFDILKEILDIIDNHPVRVLELDDGGEALITGINYNTQEYETATHKIYEINLTITHLIQKPEEE